MPPDMQHGHGWSVVLSCMMGYPNISMHCRLARIPGGKGNYLHFISCRGDICQLVINGNQERQKSDALIGHRLEGSNQRLK